MKELLCFKRRMRARGEKQTLGGREPSNNCASFLSQPDRDVNDFYRVWIKATFSLNLPNRTNLEWNIAWILSDAAPHRPRTDVRIRAEPTRDWHAHQHIRH